MESTPRDTCTTRTHAVSTFRTTQRHVAPKVRARGGSYLLPGPPLACLLLCVFLLSLHLCVHVCVFGFACRRSPQAGASPLSAGVRSGVLRSPCPHQLVLLINSSAWYPWAVISSLQQMRDPRRACVQGLCACVSPLTCITALDCVRSPLTRSTVSCVCFFCVRVSTVSQITRPLTSFHPDADAPNDARRAPTVVC